MAINLTKMTANVNNIQALSDLPNQTDGLDAQGLKERFDKAGGDIKTFLNTSLIPEIEELMNLIYPIRRGFIDFTDTDYSNYLGFTWERELVGMTPVGLDISDNNFNAVGKTGGEKTHTLTTEEIPSHGHKWLGVNDGASTAGQMGNYPFRIYQDRRVNWNGTTSMIENTGGGQAHNNLQPYQVVSYWKRVS